MSYRFHLCDVFTEERFAGNQLAVLPEAEGLSGAQMQRIAREFNFSETTFVLPPESGGTRRVRIFTPHDEIPFAGHPNIGTAFVLAATGALGVLEASTSVRFEERAGVVPIDITAKDGRPTRCELAAPAPLAIGPEAPLEAVAATLSLSSDEIVTNTHAPIEASVGLGFLFVELRDRAALERVRIDPAAAETLKREDVELAVHVYTQSRDDFDVRARVLIVEGGYEDPATGSANCALMALLTHLDPAPTTTRSLRIAQGVEMGRPSILEASAEKREGEVVRACIGGGCVLVGEGTLSV